MNAYQWYKTNPLPMDGSSVFFQIPILGLFSISCLFIYVCMYVCIHIYSLEATLVLDKQKKKVDIHLLF